jgi:hypothetical protein
MSIKKEIKTFFPSTEESWEELIDKHPLRYDVWMILQIYHEKNVSDIAKLTKRNKSTLSRVLRSMEEDRLVLSRKENLLKEGKIPAKYYRINPEIKEEVPDFEDILSSTDPQKLLNFYEYELTNYQKAIYNGKKLLDYLNPLLDHLKGNLDDIEEAKQIYAKYWLNISRPWFNLIYLDEECYEKFFDIRLEYMLKLEKLAREHKLDTNSAFIYFDFSLPLKNIFELKKKELQKNE